MTAADLALADLADENGALREKNRQLVDLVADLSFELGVLRVVYEREQLNRIHGDATIARLYRLLNLRQAA